MLPVLGERAQIVVVLLVVLPLWVKDRPKFVYLINVSVKPIKGSATNSFLLKRNSFWILRDGKVH